MQRVRKGSANRNQQIFFSVKYTYNTDIYAPNVIQFTPNIRSIKQQVMELNLTTLYNYDNTRPN